MNDEIENIEKIAANYLPKNIEWGTDEYYSHPGVHEFYAMAEDNRKTQFMSWSLLFENLRKGVDTAFDSTMPLDRCFSAVLKYQSFGEVFLSEILISTAAPYFSIVPFQPMDKGYKRVIETLSPTSDQMDEWIEKTIRGIFNYNRLYKKVLFYELGQYSVEGTFPDHKSRIIDLLFHSRDGYVL